MSKLVKTEIVCDRCQKIIHNEYNSDLRHNRWDACGNKSQIAIDLCASCTNEFDVWMKEKQKLLWLGRHGEHHVE